MILLLARCREEEGGKAVLAEDRHGHAVLEARASRCGSLTCSPSPATSRACAAEARAATSASRLRPRGTRGTAPTSPGPRALIRRRYVTEFAGSHHQRPSPPTGGWQAMAAGMVGRRLRHWDLT